MNLKVSTVAACDVKPAALRYIRMNHKGKVAHLYGSFQDQTKHTGCLIHTDSGCDYDDVINCLFTGNPCQAWTRFRNDKDSIPPSEHPGWFVTFTELFGYIDGHTVHGGVYEQVLGFMDQDLKSPPEELHGHATPYDLFTAMLETRNFAHRTLRLNMSQWVSAPPRDRIYVIYVSETLGGEQAAAWIEAACKDPCTAVVAGKGQHKFKNHAPQELVLGMSFL